MATSVNSGLAGRLQQRADARQLERVEIRDVSKHYPTRDGLVHALDRVSFVIQGGEFVSLLGPSGCGKSTLLMMVAGLLAPSDGAIAIDGRRVAGPQTEVGIVFQNPVLLDWRRTIDNILLQIEMRRLNTTEYRPRAMDLLQSVGLGGFEDKYPFELSGGMQQRVSICRALIHNPPLLLMDEPFSALDALTRDQFNLDLQGIWEQHHKTAIFVTHSIAEAVFLSDRVVVMSPRPGRIETILDIDLPRPRTLDMRETPEFARHSRAIRDIFQARGVLGSR
jgi:NitT/TauT family transport system ATP-binding protein